MTDLPLSPDDVAEIVSLLDGGGYDRLDIRTTRFRLRVNREGEGWTQDWDFSESDAPAAVVVSAEAIVLPEGVTGIAAPLPGTFYRAPSPGAASLRAPGRSTRVTKETPPIQCTMAATCSARAKVRSSMSHLSRRRPGSRIQPCRREKLCAYLVRSRH